MLAAKGLVSPTSYHMEDMLRHAHIHEYVRVQYSLYYFMELWYHHTVLYLAIVFIFFPPVFQLCNIMDLLSLSQYVVGCMCIASLAIVTIRILLRPDDEEETMKGCDRPQYLFCLRSVTYTIATISLLYHRASYTPQVGLNAMLVSCVYALFCSSLRLFGMAVSNRNIPMSCPAVLLYLPYATFPWPFS